MNTPKNQLETLFDIFTTILKVDEEIFTQIIDILRKENIPDIIEHFSKEINQKYLRSSIIKLKNVSNENEVNKLEDIGNDIKVILNTLKKIKDNDINLQNFSSEQYLEFKKVIMSKIKENQKLRSFLKFLVHLTSVDKQFIVCGSNSLHLLVEINVDLKNQCFENIKIKNTSLIGGNFFRCNLSGSVFENVDISGVNLNGAILFNCNWEQIKVDELNYLQGHKGSISQVCFSPDGTTLASGGGSIFGDGDCSIRLWDVKTGQQKAKLNGHFNGVLSVCFSSDGTTLASGGHDNSIRLWDVKTQNNQKQIEYLVYENQALDR
ncbi:unnamed protein product [Paramecium sonneborni]|uniref:Uncharacterized protein n=1 Tax=Paramecium sonneborni TaxID=65129 RepID=A0A8S1MLV8_9CILI|nr:unnamed protein product [Paramecium sonneborni]